MRPVYQCYAPVVPPTGRGAMMLFPTLYHGAIDEKNTTMCAEHTLPLDDIFEEALQLPEIERPSFLDDRCAEYPELRQRLERMLEYYRDAPPDSFLNPDLFWARLF